MTTAELLSVDAGHELWPSFVDHIERLKMTRDALAEGSAAQPDHHYLVAAVDKQVVGNLVLHLRPLMTRTLNDEDDLPVARDGRPLTETFVATFGVEEPQRRRGIGRRLQVAGLDMSRRLGAYQMRSWSSADKPANWALKLSLGFSAHPERQYIARLDKWVWGTYFTKTLD